MVEELDKRQVSDAVGQILASCLGWRHLGVVRSRQTTLSRLQFDNHSPPEMLDTAQLLRFLW
jgi:hypothetical protein